MSPSTDKHSTFNIVCPAAASEKLLFRVFDNATSIGYARLTKIKDRRINKDRVQNIIDMFDPCGFTAYEIKMIEVSQNYRQLGVGTSLLQEVIQYCKDSNINRLTGEIKGDARTLRHWYLNNGFQICNDDRIELLPTSK